MDKIWCVKLRILDFSRQIQYWRLPWYLVHILAKYVITQIHACRELKQTRTLLDCSLVRKRKFYEKQDENDQKAVVGVRCDSYFVGPPPSLFATLATLNLFNKPVFCFISRAVQRCSGTIQQCENIYTHMALVSMFVQNVERYCWLPCEIDYCALVEQLILLIFLH